MRVSAEYAPNGRRTNSDIAKLNLDLFGHHQLDEGIEFHWLYEISEREQTLAEANVVKTVNDLVEVKVGQTRLNAGGFEAKALHSDGYPFSPWAKHIHPFPRSQPVLGLNLAQMFEIQITNDVTTHTTSAAAFNHRNRQPAVLIAWIRKKDDLSLTAQGGLYDGNHSGFGTLGFMYDTSATLLSADLTYDHRQRKYLDNTQYVLIPKHLLNAAASWKLKMLPVVVPFTKLYYFSETQQAKSLRGEQTPVGERRKSSAYLIGIEDHEAPHALKRFASFEKQVGNSEVKENVPKFKLTFGVYGQLF